MTVSARASEYTLDFDTPTHAALQEQLVKVDASAREKFGMTPDHTAVGVLDLAATPPRLALLNPDRETYAASVPKVGILLGYFALRPEAAENLDPTIRRELGEMIKISSNEMAAKYSRELGIKNIQGVLDQYHFYDKGRGGGLWVGKHYGKDAERYGSPVGDNSHAATVRQLLRFYLLLEQGKLVSPAASKAMREIFESPAIAHDDHKFTKGLKGRDVQVIRKSGTWKNWLHDTAVVTGGGRHYILVALTEHPKGDEYVEALAPAVDDLLKPAPAPAPAIPESAKKPPEFKSGEPVFAFNGKDLAGLYTYLRENKYEDPNKVFSVKDGMLVISGQEWGGITTKDTFHDYHLVTEWKWGERQWELLLKGLDRPKGCARDAGILVHAVGADGAAYGHWLESVEVQIIEGGVGDFLLVGGKGQPGLTCEVRKDGKQLYYHPGGESVAKRGGRINWWGRDPNWQDKSGYRGPSEVEKPHGEWNRLEVLCDGDNITTILNGVVVNAGTKSKEKAGKIQLQSEGAEIIFRKFEVRPLLK